MFVPQLLDAKSFEFSYYLTPKYPPLAKMARISGQVVLELTLDAATGEVLNAVAISGHPLLRTSALDAAKQWRMEPQSVRGGKLKATLKYSLRCP